MSLTTFSGPVVSQNGFIDSSFTTAERDAIVDPQAGLLIYNTTVNEYQVYNGTGWQEAFGGGPAPGPTTYTLNTDYTYLSYVSFQGNVVDLRGVSNEGLRSAILALQVNDTFEMTTGGTSYTMTVTSPFTVVGGNPNSYTAAATSSPTAVDFADYNTITV